MDNEDNNLDPETTDVPDIARAISETATKIANIERGTADVRSFIRGIQAQDQQMQQEQARTAMLEEIYNTCDEEHGGEHRSEAMTLANAKVASGEVARPTTVPQGLRLMQKCYAEVAAKKKVAETPRELSVTTVSAAEEFKPGTLDEVARDMRKKMAAGTWRRQFNDPGV
jgi:hypothetical protein